MLELWKGYLNSMDRDAFCRGLTARQLEAIGDRLTQGTAYSERYLTRREHRRGVELIEGYDEFVQMDAEIYLEISRVKHLGKDNVRLLRLLSYGEPVESIARIFGVDKSTIYYRIKQLTKAVADDKEACIISLLIEVFGLNNLRLI